jgi:hypothetical protein
MLLFLCQAFGEFKLLFLGLLQEFKFPAGKLVLLFLQFLVLLFFVFEHLPPQFLFILLRNGFLHGKEVAAIGALDICCHQIF